MTTTKLDVFEIRRENLSRLLEQKGAKTQLALRLGTNQSYVSFLLKPPGAASARAIKEETARKIEEVMGLQPGTLDRPSRNGSTVLTAREPAPRGPAPPGHVDANLLEDTVRAVISAAAEAHAKLVADKTAQIVRLVYEHAEVHGHVDPGFVSSLVKLMR